MESGGEVLSAMPEELRRYSRQLILPQFGVDGQRLLSEAHVTLIGCGALGSTIAQLLARGGIGRLVLVDRDRLEQHNLHRQLLYTEADVTRPKARAAAQTLATINSSIEVEGRVLDVDARSIEPLIDGTDLVMDATDNLATRYLINDACVKYGIPWIYGGAVGTYGMRMAIIPGETACFRCIFPEPPAADALPSCDTNGILNALPVMIGALQVAAAYRLLIAGAASGALTIADIWEDDVQFMSVARAKDCRCCVQRDFTFLTEDAHGR